MARAAGIDLGTTHSVIAAWEDGELAVIPDADASPITPSVVAFTENGERLVGQLARRQAILNPRGTTYSVKRIHETVLVFDLGGATFDLSILDVGDGVVEVRATAGDTHLGGVDFDREIVDHLTETFQEGSGPTCARTRGPCPTRRSPPTTSTR